MKSGKYCDLCRKEITVANMISVKIRGESYVFDSYECTRIFNKFNTSYNNIFAGE